jgi:GT2 family glycosyltransferase
MMIPNEVRSDSPVASVIIPNYNGEQLLPTVLASLRRQSFRDFEVIVVDDASTDKSVSLVASDYPEVQIVQRKQNGDFARAVNSGLSYAKGEYVVLLNNDTIPADDWLQELVNALETHKEVDFGMSKILNVGSGHIDSAGDEFEPRSGAISAGRGLTDGFKFSQQRYCFSACAASAIYRRTFFDKVGTFDEAYEAYYEDVDIAFRAQLLNMNCLFVPESHVLHVGGATNAWGGDRQMLLSVTNFVLMAIKNYPRELLVEHLPYLVFRYLIRFPAWLYLRQGKRALALRICARFILKLPHFAGQRLSVQRAKRIRVDELSAKFVPHSNPEMRQTEGR